MMPRIMGIKSPMRLMEGINNIGKASKTNTIAMTVITEMDFGRANIAILFVLSSTPDNDRDRQLFIFIV